MWSKAPKKILIVDDEELVSRLLVRVLTKSGHQAYAARSAVSAMEMYNANKPFDALLCDLHLGADSGWSVSKEIYNLQPTIVVLILTGYLDVELGPPGLPYSVLKKPFTPSELTEALNSHW